ncbi:Hvo_1808 family surface protein [Halorientalis salina]|uniref:Hvo_1808 family surface protein n=1 Tax=Halorientalis salina TaxID=2932266 RepID=UPI0010AC685A|nr:Hvo_1808 family surface protein [Halorientalis salina]
MRKAAWVALAVLVVLAGCNFLGGSSAPSDPEADAIGWENGYWHNETLDVSNEDGLNESEREAVVSRAMARVEYVRDTEFEESVRVEIISREEYRNEQTANYTDRFRTFDNAKFEAMFFVGEDRDSLTVQRETMGSNVLGYYSPANDSIKLVAEDGNPTIDGEGTLAHELVHAMQDQRHNLSSMRAGTRDAYNARNGLVEGEANLIQQRYERRCGGTWECVEGESSGGSGGTRHWGITLMEYFPYSDGPGFVATLLDRGGWDAVDAAFDDAPTSSEQVIYPDRYTDSRDDPTRVSLSDSTANGWERVRPDPQRSGTSRPEHATLGQSVLSSMFAYTAFDDEAGALIDRDEFATGDSTDPFDYDLPVTEGWEGDRLHVYRNPDTAADETAYVWRIEWESAAEAEEFARGYRRLLGYYGGQGTSQADTWRIPEGENGFADAFRVTRDGSTVTIVNAPTVEDLTDVHDGS